MTHLWFVLALLPILGGAAQRFSCKGRILGAYYADAKSGCKAFHVCVRVAGGGIRDFRFFCPPGTLFQTEAQTCTDWGDDDPLACPADLYDGQFDLYKIGSGFDTKKTSSSSSNGNRGRDEEPEFGLQQAETGDRRLSQQSQNNAPVSDLRTAHSSDFFSGQRERGRDEPQQASATSSRQSFRRATTPRSTPSATTYITSSSSAANPSNPPQQEFSSKRKLVRKRPIYVTSTAAPSTYAQTSQQTFFSEPQKNQKYYSEPQKNQQYFSEPQKNQQYFSEQQKNQQYFSEPQKKTQQYFSEPQKKHLATRPKLEERVKTTTPNIPPQFKEYKDEYVEVSRVTPKQRVNQNNVDPTPFAQTSTAPRLNKKQGLAELYNYEAQTTVGLNQQNAIKLRNSFHVAPESPRDVAQNNVNVVHNGARTPSSTPDYSASTRNYVSSTSHQNYNSVSYEPERKQANQQQKKQNHFNSSPKPTPSIYTTRPEHPSNLNTVAYNTNIGFNAQPINYAESDEDDGQYRPSPEDDDGQYRPELYEKELLSGAHSLNIAASGNRLPEDQKPRSKTQPPTSQTASPRPFKLPTTKSQSFQTTFGVPESTFTTTVRPQSPSTQRTFDYVQTYTTTARPTELNSPLQVSLELVAPRQPSTAEPQRTAAPRPSSRAPPPPSLAPQPRPTKKPQFAKPANKNEDNSYDYAYYDSDPGYSEYDHIEEFGKTKTKL